MKATVYSLPARHVIEYRDEAGNVTGYEFNATQYGACNAAEQRTGGPVRTADWNGLLRTQKSIDAKLERGKRR